MGKWQRDTNHIGQIGASWVRWVVEGLWACGVETVSAHNDNSLDALFFLKRRKNSAYAGPTGDVIFVQIKTGYVRKKPASGTYQLNLGKEHIAVHRPRWLAFPGPVIMINVIPPHVTLGDPEAYWTDLRDPASFTNSGAVVFDTKRKLEGPGGKASLFNLCWRWAEFRALPIVEAPEAVGWSRKHPGRVSSSAESVRACGRVFYSDWMVAARSNPSQFWDVKITNRGWRHMTRIGRSKSRMLQSLLLLPAASKMLESASRLHPQRITRGAKTSLPSGHSMERYYEALTARVTFFERQEAVVRVVLERTITMAINGSVKVIQSDIRTLYSIYEVARRRGTV